MSELDPRHRALLDRLRADEEPSAEQLDAVLDRVLAAGPAPAAPAVTKLTLLKGGLAVAAVGAVAIPLIGSSDAPEPRVLEPAPVVAQEPTVDDAIGRPEAIPEEEPAVEEKPAVKQADPAPERSVPATKAASPRKSGVAEEVALMGRIRRAIQAEDSDRALRLLRQHARRFPNGVFADEREVSLAEALCAAGKIDKGREVANGFVAKNPQSSLAARARRACAAGQTSPAGTGRSP
jgi:hypothetical protein